MRRMVSLFFLVGLVGCTARAGMALLPQVGVRATARLERSPSRSRWRHDVRVLATFHTDAQVPRAPLSQPSDQAPVTALANRAPCRVVALCEWEAAARRDAWAAFQAR